MLAPIVGVVVEEEVSEEGEEEAESSEKRCDRESRVLGGRPGAGTLRIVSS